MKKIIYFWERRLQKRDIKRIGLNFFLKKKVDIRLLNIGPYINKKKFEGFIPPNQFKFKKEKILSSKKQIIDSINKMNSLDTVIFPLNLCKELKFIIDELTKNKINYGYKTNIDAVPQKNIFELILPAIMHPIAAIKKIIRRTQYHINNFDSYGNPNFILSAGDKHYAISKKNFGNKKIIQVPHQDYDLFILNKRVKSNKTKQHGSYAVYVDRMHIIPDDIAEGENIYGNHFPPVKKICSHKEFYDPLNRFLKKFIDTANLNLKIAAHPKANYRTNNPFKYGKIYYNKTAELIENSQVVLMHNSTAVSFAVLFNKPIIFLTQNNFTAALKRNTNHLSKFFKKKPINMSDTYFDYARYLKEKKINAKIYAMYKKEYLTNIKNSQKTSYEIIYDHFINNKLSN